MVPVSLSSCSDRAEVSIPLDEQAHLSTKRTAIANVSGRLWSALMSFAFVPFYLRFMGPEAYGLVGFFTSMLATFFVLDMGLSTTLNREMARLSVEKDGIAVARTLMRTLETIYWAVGVAIGLLVVVIAPLIAQRWLNTANLTADQVAHAVQLMGVSLMLRWPVFLYQGALMGMRRHVSMNLIMSLASALQGGGAVLVLWLVSRSPTAFFGWQIIASGVQIVLLAGVTWSSLRMRGHRPRFERTALRSVLSFSAGITGITLLSVVLTQLDKLLLSKLLPLDQFGYYTLATAIAAVLTTAAAAIYGAVFPALSRLVAAERIDELSVLYHRSCQALSLLIFPVAMTLIFFSHELLAVYTQSKVIADASWKVLSILTVGYTLLAVMTLPLALQLSFGWVKLSLYKNVVAVLVFVPLLVLMVRHYGALGAALVWVMLTLGYFLVEVQIMHRRLLPGEAWRWYFTDVGAPALSSFAVMGLARLALPPGLANLGVLLAICIAALVALACSTLASPFGRNMIRRLYARIGPRDRSTGAML